MRIRRPRAAFVVVTAAALAACHKEPANGECKPPDCHMNPPPPQPTPSMVPNSANPPAIVKDAGAK